MDCPKTWLMGKFTSMRWLLLPVNHSQLLTQQVYPIAHLKYSGCNCRIYQSPLGARQGVFCSSSGRKGEDTNFQDKYCEVSCEFDRARVFEMSHDVPIVHKEFVDKFCQRTRVKAEVARRKLEWYLAENPGIAGICVVDVERELERLLENLAEDWCWHDHGSWDCNRIPKPGELHKIHNFSEEKQSVESSKLNGFILIWLDFQSLIPSVVILMLMGVRFTKPGQIY